MPDRPTTTPRPARVQPAGSASTGVGGLSRRVPLLIGVVLLAVLMGTATVRWTGVGASRLPQSPVVAMSAFHFQDQADGSIAVRNAHGQLVHVVEPGTNGFLRGAMRGVARERKRMGLDDRPPFHLAGHADGRLTLQDPATGRVIDLGSFGPTNAEVFARLLRDAQAPSEPAARAQPAAPTAVSAAASDGSRHALAATASAGVQADARPTLRLVSQE